MSHAPGPFTPEGVRWADRPRPRRGPKIPVAKILPGRTYDYRVLVDAITGVEVHYDGDRCEPCTGGDGDCWFPHEAQPPRWQGWLYVWDRVAKRAELVCLTAGAFDQVEKVLKAAQSLRGARLQLWRKGKGQRSLMGATLELEPQLCDVYLPDPIDVRKQLNLMWTSPLRDAEREAARQKRYAAMQDKADDEGRPAVAGDDVVPF